uniref:glucan endo-1,3-beta-D-glucosidase n=1 Tax=Cannabis sativa TaxID=3483 RepID=A0A803R3V7_CANSA
MLKFLQETNSPLMVNPYPYFGYNPKMPNYSLFKPNRGIRDPKTGITYTNMFDAQMDAVHTAAKAIGFGNVELVIGETGWSSACEWEVCSIEHARDYNANLIKHINSGKGTPLMPNRKFETYLFALFNENLKPGPLGERNWGLFSLILLPFMMLAFCAMDSVLAVAEEVVAVAVEQLGRSGAYQNWKQAVKHCRPILITYAAQVWTVSPFNQVAPVFSPMMLGPMPLSS